MTVAVVRYNAGNIQSVRLALERQGVRPVVTDDPETIRAADRIIFPGVGEASSAMRFLSARGLDRLLPALVQPVLGICLGLQLLCGHSEEGDTPCMGVFGERVRRFPPTGKIPHVGWNTIGDLDGPLFAGIETESHVYFVHGYYAETGTDTIARTEYIVPFSAALRRRNFYATQFHPEKSGEVGDRILANFLVL